MKITIKTQYYLRLNLLGEIVKERTPSRCRSKTRYIVRQHLWVLLRKEHHSGVRNRAEVIKAWVWLNIRCLFAACLIPNLQNCTVHWVHCILRRIKCHSLDWQLVHVILNYKRFTGAYIVHQNLSGCCSDTHLQTVLEFYRCYGREYV